jgi:hypothetical protein
MSAAFALPVNNAPAPAKSAIASFLMVISSFDRMLPVTEKFGH